jgi:hypothetical protein
MGAGPWVAHTQYAFAVMLMKRNQSRDQEHAIELLDTVVRTCEELAMPALRTKGSAALNEMGVVTSTMPVEVGAVADRTSPIRQTESPTPAGRYEPASAEDGTFRLDGEYWTVGYDGRVLRLKDSKGLRVLSRLLSNPGRPYAALDLERLGSTGDEVIARAVASGDAGEHLDDEARRAYRARLLELHEAVDEEDAESNAEQADAMRDEIDFITRELGRALGLGGRPRHAGSIAERARLNVTRAVKSAMQRIAAADAGLATHLEATVHTGAVCVYSPDPRSPVGWHASLGAGEDS